MKERYQAKKDIRRLFNKLITLQKLVSESGGYGQNSAVYTDYRKMWASVSNLYGREFFEAKQVNAEKTIKIIIRYIPDIDESMRVVMDGKFYNINFVDNVKYGNELIEIKALEEGAIQDEL